MTFVVGGTTVEKFICNDVDLDKAYMNEAIVFEKAPVESTITVAYYNGFYGYSSGDAGEFGKITPNIVHGYNGAVKLFQWGGTFYDDIVVLELELAAPLISGIRVTMGDIVVEYDLQLTSTTLHGGTSYSSNSPFANAPKSGAHPIKFEAIA